jgi:hypothetical protein
MIPTPPPPNRAPEVFCGPQDFIARLSPGCCRLPGFGIATGGNDGMGTPIGNGVMTSTGTKRTGKVLNDDRADWREAWALFPGDVAYVWHGALHATTVAESLVAAGFNVRSQIIWQRTGWF